MTKKIESPPPEGARCTRCEGSGRILMPGDAHRSEGWVPCNWTFTDLEGKRSAWCANGRIKYREEIRKHGNEPSKKATRPRQGSLASDDNRPSHEGRAPKSAAASAEAQPVEVPERVGEAPRPASKIVQASAELSIVPQRVTPEMVQVWTVWSTINERGDKGISPIGHFQSMLSARRAAEGKGWYGGKGTVEGIWCVRFGGKLYWLRSREPITLSEDPGPTAEELRAAALAKLTPEERTILGLDKGAGS